MLFGVGTDAAAVYKCYVSTYVLVLLMASFPLSTHHEEGKLQVASQMKFSEEGLNYGGSSLASHKNKQTNSVACGPQTNYTD
jgi:hypothetical protein